MFNEVAVSRLEEPLNIEDLMGRCPEFSIRLDDENAILEQDIDISNVYNFDDLQEYCLNENLEPCSDNEDDDDITRGNISSSFPIFRKRMHNLTEDGKVMKVIDTEGVGELIGQKEEVLYAYVHYAGYFEFSELPFDVTRLRQKKCVPLKLGSGDIIPGLEIAIRSMKEKESAKFLIHHDLAFGTKGVPPRIPQSATVLFVVELNRFSVDVKDVPTVPETFEERMAQVKKCRSRGNTLKMIEKKTKDAIILYRKGIFIALQNYANEEEEREAEKELVKLYSNLAVCYMELKNYKKVCSMYNDAQHDCPRLAPKHSKLLYNSAKALRNLGDYNTATIRLRRALQYCSGDESVLKEMKILSERKEKDRRDELNICRNMFGIPNQPLSKSQEEEILKIMNCVDDDFKESVEEILDDFQESDEKTEEFKEGFSGKQLEYFRKKCAERNIEVRTAPGDELTGLPRVIIKKRLL